MSIGLGGEVVVPAATPLQCLDCSALMHSGNKDAKCRNFPEGIPSEKQTCLCLHHEYKLKSLKSYRIR